MIYDNDTDDIAMPRGTDNAKCHW